MKYPQVKHLYKYRAYDANSLAILINKKIWTAKPEALNDPFDCKIKFTPPEINSDAFKEYLKQTGRSTGNQQRDYEIFLVGLQEFYEKDINNFGVFSMTKINDDILMWSHYANKHKGFCIGFDRKNDNLLGNIKKTLPVQYEPNYPEADPLDKNGDYNHTLFMKMLFTKAKNWKYEKEWRLVFDEGDKEESLPADISTVIFGLKTPEEHKVTIQNILSGQPNIQYKQATEEDYQFRLKIVDL